MEKLKYDQKNVYDKLSSINVTRINDKRIIKKIKASFQKFRPNFYEEIKPIIIEISIYENIVLNIFFIQKLAYRKANFSCASDAAGSVYLYDFHQTFSQKK